MREGQVRLMKDKLKKKSKGSPQASLSASTSKTAINVAEVDMFSPQSTVVTNKKLLSPVKTNPLKEAEKVSKPAQYVSNTPDWCPSLMHTTKSRVLSGAEAEKVKGDIGFIDRPKEMAAIARNDLADSDDEDLNEFGKAVSKRIARDKNLGISKSSPVKGWSGRE